MTAAHSHRYNNRNLDDQARWLQDNSDALNQRARFQGIALSHFERWCRMEHHFELESRADAESIKRESTITYRGYDIATGIPAQGEI